MERANLLSSPLSIKYLDRIGSHEFLLRRTTCTEVSLNGGNKKCKVVITDELTVYDISISFIAMNCFPLTKIISFFYHLQYLYCT